ncbi:unnamed protein product [Hymenolepis diminuta]|uniref:LanC-like protein 3 homolog n=1 Tax=Hymenolepis diminuta TaxID=6216 RepID=A0A564Y770_HYMDI|nr:unnamed protein product [Hymenolepis diminuta]
MRHFANPYIASTGEVITSSLPNANDFAQESLEMIERCFRNSCRKISCSDGNLYVGGIGVAWSALRVIHKLNTGFNNLLPLVRTYIEGMVDRICQTSARDNEDLLSFLLGRPGVWLTAVYLYQLTGDNANRDHFLELYGQISPKFASRQIFPQGSDELFIGRAGYLCGLYELRKITSQSVISDDTIFEICDAMIESGQNYAKIRKSACPLMYAYYDTEYLGAGHGLAGILFALMLFPRYLRERSQSTQLVRAAIDYLICVTPPDTDNLPTATDELAPRHRPVGHDLVHWCHGAAGAVYVYARAYQLWKDQKYLDEVFKCADVAWHRGLLKKGPGICHGVAGSGYVQLVAYRATGCTEKRFEDRARACAAFLHEEAFKRGARRPDNPYSLFEGLAGTACFLADLAGSVDQAAFPFMDPFGPVES